MFLANTMFNRPKPIPCYTAVVMQRSFAHLCILAVFLMLPLMGEAFDEIDQVGAKNYKPMKGCPNCHVPQQSASGELIRIGASLPNAVLKQADLKGADMRGANLRESDLRQADLRNAKLGGADLRSADLSGADLGGTNLFNANLTRARLHGKYGPARLCKTVMPDGSLNNSNCDGQAEDVSPRPLASANQKPAQYRHSFNFLGFEINLP
ncbi:pentapeptide repeat-containing protein [Alphaproteobacteria bacterium]|nr:pentapeptide repeat-containing protein [Alphaproteobacteria bacterium]